MPMKNVEWAQIPFGPFVMRTKLPDYIIKRLLNEIKNLYGENLTYV